MRRNFASKETIEVLIANSQKAISDFEHMLHNVEFIKSKLCNKGLSINYCQLVFELLSGNLLGLYEMCIDLKCMLSTSNVYVKRFHMQMINLSQYEWCKYLVGRDQRGVMLKIINHLKELHKETKELESILQQLRLLGQKCDTALRNITAHYDDPNIMYSMLVSLNDEDVYAKRVGDQLLIHDMMLEYLSLFLQAISQTLSIGDIANVKKRISHKLNVQNIVNNKVAKDFNDKESLDVIIEDQIADAWNNIESHKRMLNTCERIIAFFKSKKLDYTRFIEIKSVVEMQMAVSFMQYDLACSMNAYLKASSNAERSISFMRAYRIETNALSHLYGYNEKYREKSIWNKIRIVPEFKFIPLSNEIEDELIALTSHLDSTKRNLYTHYRENIKLNISERWQCANEMDYPRELMQMLRLVTLCKNINQFLVILVSSISSTEKQKNDEMLKLITKIKELASQNNQQEIVEMSDKLLSMFSLFDRKL